jgi:Ca-activated chloride channel family protein
MRYLISSRHVALAMAGVVAAVGQGGQLDAQEVFRFRTGVELINVTATVTDRSGRFVLGLQQADFSVYDDDHRVDVTHFSAERVPVSLGIVLDTSGSMMGDKIAHARAAIERFLDQLLGPDDEVFLYRFSNDVELVQGWTTNREAVSAALKRVRAVGGTAMYDAVMEAIPLAQKGRNRKKAVVLISDGHDTHSRMKVEDVRQVVRGTDVLVYAIGIDGREEPTITPRRPTFPLPPTPFPIPGRGRPPTRWPPRWFPAVAAPLSIGEPSNASALREITDSSGGRTEVVRDSRDLDPATSTIADELSKQYVLGYSSPGQRDGRWHAIRVEVRDPSLRVRARRGYTAAS